MNIAADAIYHTVSYLSTVPIPRKTEEKLANHEIKQTGSTLQIDPAQETRSAWSFQEPKSALTQEPCVNLTQEHAHQHKVRRSAVQDELQHYTTPLGTMYSLSEA